jgi:hypothetical protein
MNGRVKQILIALSRLKKKKRKKEKRKSVEGRVATLHLRGGKETFPASKVPGKYPLVLPVKVCLRKVKL